jgi:hypothetical protein
MLSYERLLLLSRSFAVNTNSPIFIARPKLSLSPLRSCAVDGPMVFNCRRFGCGQLTRFSLQRRITFVKKSEKTFTLSGGGRVRVRTGRSPPFSYLPNEPRKLMVLI